MNNVKKFLTVVCFALVANFASASDLTYNKKPEGAQIQTLLNAIDFTNYLKVETKVNISFFVNEKNEVIVVDTNNKDLDGIVKSTLNYKKIAVTELEYNKVYTVPVQIK
ncbi:MAG: hypothetical protein IPL55_04450 [Saprospiraceae bacterium]|nr:hypothetical protein [Saprospiraceae bacterium]